jgi:predicted nucleotidyltransferase
MSTNLERPFLPAETIYLNSNIKDKLRREHTAELFYLCVSGSHLYGMSSPDSDIDVRGCYVLNTNKLLGLNRPIDHAEWKITQTHPSCPEHPNGIEICLTEIAKETGLALKSNCNVLEHLSALPLYADADAYEWRKLLLEGMSKNGVYNSYKGLATFNYHKFLKTGKKKTVKKYLYVFRGLLAGAYALQNKAIQPNILLLSKYFQVPEIKKLIKAKSQGTENSGLPKGIKEEDLDSLLIKCFERIDKAYEKSTLQNEPDEEYFETVNSWIIKLRKKYLT